MERKGYAKQACGLPQRSWWTEQRTAVRSALTLDWARFTLLSLPRERELTTLEPLNVIQIDTNRVFC